MSQANTSQPVDNAAQPKPVKLNPPQFAKVGDLLPMQKEVNLVVRVVKLEAIASTNRNGAPVTVYECLLGDETGTIIFTARPNQLDLLKVGNLLVIRNAFVTIFKEYMRLRVDRWGSIRTYEDDASKVPADCQAPAVNAAAFTANEDKAKNVSLTAYERVDDKDDNDNNNNNNGGDNNQGGNRRPRRNNNNRRRNSRGGNNNNNNGPRDGGDNNNNNSNNNNGPRGRNNNRRNSNNDNNNNQYNSPSRRPNNNNNRRQSGGNRNNNNNNSNSNNNDNYNKGNRQGGNRDDNNRDGQPRRNNNRPPRRNNNNNSSNTNANTNN